MIVLMGALSILFLVMMYFTIRNAWKQGRTEKELEVEKHVNEIQEKRDEIAKQPSLSASRLLEWMRSPHSRY